MRAEMMARDKREAFRLFGYKRLLKGVANTAFAGVCVVLPMLLIVTPTSNLYDPSRDDLQLHFGIFVVFIIVSYSVVLAHFISARQVTTPSWVWFTGFSILTLGVCVCGRIAVGTYDFGRCPSAARGDHGIQKRPDGSPIWPDTAGDAECIQSLVVPVPLMATLDFGWFAFLCMTTLFLPHAASIRFNYKLVQPETKHALRKFRAAALLEVVRARVMARPPVTCSHSDPQQRLRRASNATKMRLPTVCDEGRQVKSHRDPHSFSETSVPASLRGEARKLSYVRRDYREVPEAVPLPSSQSSASQRISTTVCV